MHKATTADFWAIPRSRRRAALTQAVLAYAAMGVSIVMNIVLLPMYLRHIPERLYGLWLGTGGVIAWLGMLDLGIASVMGQRLAAAYGRKDAKSIGLYYFNGLVLQTCLMIVLMLLAAALCPFLPGWLKATPDEARVLTRCNLLACLAMGLTFLGYGQKNTADALLRPFVPSLMLTVGGLFTVAVIVVSLRCGLGLYALPLGMVAGSLITLIVTLIHGLLMVRQASGELRGDRATLLDMIRLTPAMLAGKAGNALVGRIEPTLISAALRPEDAVAFNVTRRAADIVQMTMDRILGAVVAGFAHHVAEGDRANSARILRRVVSLCFTIGMIGLATYMVANASFVSLWIGPKFFAGQTVTILVAVSVLALVFNNLFSCLLGATGDLVRPALAVGLEAVTRLALMMTLLRGLGMAGLPLAVVLSSGSFTIWLYLRLRRRLSAPGGAEGEREWPRRLAWAAVTLGSTALVGLFWRTNQWWSLFAACTVCVLALSAVWLPMDPTVREGFGNLVRRLKRQAAEKTA